jgi:hypothetical protein
MGHLMGRAGYIIITRVEGDGICGVQMDTLYHVIN